jgi:SAM-dependent methyltransferase
MLSGSMETAKLALKASRYRSAALKAALSKVQESLRSPQFAELRRKFTPVCREAPTSAAKYVQPRRWLLLNLLRAAELGLDNSSGLRILDIGCGPGYFVAFARALGHYCEGVDAPESYLTEVEREVYATLTKVLHCSGVISPLLIERFRPVPFGEQSFDLITAFWICFNRHRQPDEWGVAEWKFFIEDALGCLRPGGRLVLDLNENAERYGALRFYDDPTLEYFRSVGSVRQQRVIVPRPPAPPAASR